MAKLVRVSDDLGVTYHSIPGPSAELSLDGEAIDDTVLGQSFESNFTGLITWNISSEGFYKGVPGYCATLLKQGTPTAATGEAMSQISGQLYQIDDQSKEIWDRTASIVIYDGVTDVTNEVETFDYLFGRVTFKSTYTVVGAITVDVTYLPVVAFGRGQSFTLTQTATPLDQSDFATVCANNGYRVTAQGLRTVNLDFEGIFDTVEDFAQQLEDRNEIIIEINPDGNDKSVGRGFFRVINTNQSGNVGDNEIESITFGLNVPSGDFRPFGWQHESDTTLPTAIQKVLEAWDNETELDIEYLPNGIGGAGGKTGKVIVTDATLTNSIDSLPTFTLGFQGDGAITDA